MILQRHRERKLFVLAFALVFLISSLSVNQTAAATTDFNQNFIVDTTSSFNRPSVTDSSILRDVIRQMEPALTEFMTTFSFVRLSKTTSNLEAKYRSNKLSVKWDVSSDAKLFVVIKVSGKQYCYTNTGDYSIKLRKSTRCR
jgi:hypothetical protein